MDISDQLVNKAVVALQNVAGAGQSRDLLVGDENDDFLYLGVQLRFVPTKTSPKPEAIEIPHGIYNKSGVDVCLFMKDAAGELRKGVKKDLKDAVEEQGIIKVISLAKLKKQYESFTAKRQLAASYDLFLADSAILPRLPKLLGSKFFQKKKQPVAIDMRKDRWREQVSKALTSTFYFRAGGSNVSIRIARLSHSPAQVAANIAAALRPLLACIPANPRSVTALTLRTATSLALPIFQCLPEPDVGIVASSYLLSNQQPSSVGQHGTVAAQPGAASVVSRLGKRKRVHHADQATPATQLLTRSAGGSEAQGSLPQPTPAQCQVSRSPAQPQTAVGKSAQGKQKPLVPGAKAHRSEGVDGKAGGTQSKLSVQRQLNGAVRERAQETATVLASGLVGPPPLPSPQQQLTQKQQTPVLVGLRGTTSNPRKPLTGNEGSQSAVTGRTRGRKFSQPVQAISTEGGTQQDADSARNRKKRKVRVQQAGKDKRPNSAIVTKPKRVKPSGAGSADKKGSVKKSKL